MFIVVVIVQCLGAFPDNVGVLVGLQQQGRVSGGRAVQ